MLSGILSSFILAIAIFLASHLTVDKDFSPKVKMYTWMFLVVFLFLYIVFGIF